MAEFIKEEVSVASEEKKESTGAALSPTLCRAISIKTKFLAFLPSSDTAEIRPYENPRALQGRTVFNRYLGNG